MTDTIFEVGSRLYEYKYNSKLSDLIIAVTKADGSVVELPFNVPINDYRFNFKDEYYSIIEGTNTITITLGDLETSFEVIGGKSPDKQQILKRNLLSNDSDTHKYIEGITVTKMPDKSQYIVAQQLNIDYTGMEVSVTFTDNTTATGTIGGSANKYLVINGNNYWIYSDVGTVMQIGEFSHQLHIAAEIEGSDWDKNNVYFNIDMVGVLSDVASMEYTGDKITSDYYIGYSYNEPGNSFEVEYTNGEKVKTIERSELTISPQRILKPNSKGYLVIKYHGYNYIIERNIKANPIESIKISESSKFPSDLGVKAGDYAYGNFLDWYSWEDFKFDIVSNNESVMKSGTYNKTQFSKLAVMEKKDASINMDVIRSDFYHNIEIQLNTSPSYSEKIIAFSKSDFFAKVFNYEDKVDYDRYLLSAKRLLITRTDTYEILKELMPQDEELLEEYEQCIKLWRKFYNHMIKNLIVPAKRESIIEKSSLALQDIAKTEEPIMRRILDNLRKDRLC